MIWNYRTLHSFNKQLTAVQCSGACDHHSAFTAAQEVSLLVHANLYRALSLTEAEELCVFVDREYILDFLPLLQPTVRYEEFLC